MNQSLTRALNPCSIVAVERFEIQQYELHVATYEVEARSAAEAIQRLLQGDGDPFDGSEYVDTCEAIGLQAEDDPELADELRKLGIELTGGIVPSIRSVRHVNNSDEEQARHFSTRSCRPDSD